MTALSIVPVMAQTTSFRDVPTNHFAFEAINWVSDPANGAFMVGDAGNNFNPNSTLNMFEAAQIFAMAAGFRHLIHTLPPAEQEVFTRSFNQYRPFLESMAAEFTRWNSSADREIAFLLYRGVLSQADVQRFVTRTGTTETLTLLPRLEAVVWMVRLIGSDAAARALTLPQPNPFSDDAQINVSYRRYIYYARNAGIIQGGADGNFNPSGHFTRAQMALVFFNALATPEPEPAAIPTGTPATISGTITATHLDTNITLTSAAGAETFTFASNAVVMVDNVHRTPAFLTTGMTATVLVNSQRQILSITARSEGTSVTQPTPTPPPAAAQSLHTDEGFITAVTTTPTRSITIRTQRVSITGQVIDDSRTFNIAPNAGITRAGELVEFASIQVGDVAFFGFSGNVIHELNLMERERQLHGVLIESRPPDHSGLPTLVIEAEDGAVYELRASAATAFSRGLVQNLNWSDIRIGDRIVADVEFDRLMTVHATGTLSNTAGRLVEIRITERNSEIIIVRPDGQRATLIIMPGSYDVYSLRIGMQLQVQLDSREVIAIQVTSGAANQNPVVLGFVQSVNANNTIVVVEGQGANERTHTITVNSSTAITRGGSTLAFSDLRVNMNVHIVLTGPQSNVAQTITVLP